VRYDVRALEGMSIPLALGLNIGGAVLGALADWTLARAGLSVQAALLGKGAAFEPPLAEMLTAAVLLGALGVPLSIALLRLALHALRCEPRAFGALYRVLAPTAAVALLKIVPFAGYPLALFGGLALSSAIVARVHGIRARTAAVAVVASFLGTVAVAMAGAALARRLV
jgi:hypothetical protein